MREYKQKAARNILFTVFQILTKLLVGFFLPPYILFKLGANVYGIWVLVMVIGSYISMFDLGFSTALVKFVSEDYTENKFPELSEMVCSVLIYCFAIGIVFFCLLYGLRDVIIAVFFKKAGVEVSAVKKLLLFVGSISVLNMIGTVFTAVLVGIQRLDISNLIYITGFLLNALTVVILLIAGWGIFALVLGWGMSVLFSFVVTLICICWLVPEFRLTNPKMNFATNILRVFKLGISEFMVRLSGLVVSQLDKFLLSYFAGLNWVAFYDLAFTFVMQLRSLPGAILSVFTPLAAELKIRKGDAGIKALYEAGQRYLNVSALPIFIFSVVFVYPIITVWLGPNYAMVAWALQLIAIGNYINLSSGPAYYISLGLGQPRLGIYFSLLLMAITFILSPVLIPLFGYQGAVLSYTITSSISTMVFLRNFHRKNSFLPVKFYVQYLIHPAVILAPLALILKVFFDLLPYSGRLGIGKGLIQFAVVFLLVSVLALWRMRLVGKLEWNLVWQAIRGETKNAP